MLQARDPADMLDVVRDLGQRGLGHRVGGLPLGLDAMQLAQVSGVQAAAAGLGFEARHPVGALLGDEGGHEGDHADAAVGGQPGQHVVGYVARAVADGPGGAVREDDRGRGHLQRVAHGARGHVRQVDQHAEPLHLAHHVPAEIGQPAGLRDVGGRVGPADVVVVGQRHVPDAEGVQHPQHAEGPGDGVAAFGAEQRRDPAGSEDPIHVVRGQRELEGPGVTRDHPAGQVDLLEHDGDGALPGQRGRHVDRPELGAHPARREPGQVSMGAGDRRGQVYLGRVVAGRFASTSQPDLARVPAGSYAQRPRQVVMPIYQREPPQQGPCLERPVSHPASLRAGAQRGDAGRAEPASPAGLSPCGGAG